MVDVKEKGSGFIFVLYLGFLVCRSGISFMVEDKFLFYEVILLWCSILERLVSDFFLDVGDGEVKIVRGEVERRILFL